MGVDVSFQTINWQDWVVEVAIQKKTAMKTFGHEKNGSPIALANQASSLSVPVRPLEPASHFHWTLDIWHVSWELDIVQ